MCKLLQQSILMVIAIIKIIRKDCGNFGEFSVLREKVALVVLNVVTMGDNFFFKGDRTIVRNMQEKTLVGRAFIVYYVSVEQYLKFGRICQY